MSRAMTFISVSLEPENNLKFIEFLNQNYKYIHNFWNIGNISVSFYEEEQQFIFSIGDRYGDGLKDCRDQTIAKFRKWELKEKLNKTLKNNDKIEDIKKI